MLITSKNLPFVVLKYLKEGVFVLKISAQPKYNIYPTFKAIEAPNDSTSVLTEPQSSVLNSEDKEQNQKASLLKQTYLKWVGVSEMTLGVVNGLVSGTVTGALIAVLDMLISGVKKVSKGEMALGDIFKPSKAMSKGGKILAPAVAGFLLAENIIVAKLKTDKKKLEV